MSTMRKLLESIDSLEAAPEIVEASANVYSDSAEFTEDFYNVYEQLVQINRKVNSPKWDHWMRITDQNYATKCQMENVVLRKSIRSAMNAFDVLDNEISSAE